jgi:hypothetical protein
MTFKTKDIVLADHLMLVAGEIGRHLAAQTIGAMVRGERAVGLRERDALTAGYSIEAVKVMKCLVAGGYDIQKKEPVCRTTAPM